MKLKVKLLSLDAGGKTIAILNQEDAQELGVRPLERVVLGAGKRKITAVVNVTKKFVKSGDICVYKEIKDELKIRKGQIITAEPREELVSKKYIRKKIAGEELNHKEIRCIVDDVLERDLNDLELASFVTALHIHKMTIEENIAVTKAMVDTSEKINFPGTVVDKHSLGGVPGDKTSLLLVPVIAAAGLTIPKTSSRSITSPAGTADRMEVLAPVDLGVSEIKRVVKKCGGCLIWGGAVELAPADDLFIRIENPLSLDPLLLPSVISKKKVVGSKFVVVDIPTGIGSKMSTKTEAENIAEDFKTVGKEFGIRIRCAITRADQPIGYAMGPALEAREALEVLTNKRNIPDLIDKVSSIGGLLLDMVGKGNKGSVLKLISSGKAEKKFRDIIDAQGGNPKIKPEDIPHAKHSFSVRAGVSGIVGGINNLSLDCIARSAGAPKDKLAGILLNKKMQDSVKRGEIMFTVYSEKKYKLRNALETLRSCHVFKILDKKRKKMLIERL